MKCQRKADKVYLLIVMTWMVIKTKYSVENSLMEKARYTEQSFVGCPADHMLGSHGTNSIKELNFFYYNGLVAK